MAPDARTLQLTSMTEIRLRHLPFFEALATSPSESSPEWRAANAGLLVLRLVDRALTDVERVTARELAMAHLAYRAMEQGDATAPMIRRTLQALEAESIERIAVALRDLGRVYVSQAAWALGRDVYATGVEAAKIAARDQVLLECLFGEGYAIRMLRRFDEAASHYARMHTVATRLGDTRYQLEARLGVAKLMIDRGDLKSAAGRLDRLIARAHQAGCIPIESKALHDRARVAGESGDYPSALRFAYAALQLCEDPRDRDRLLGDVAHALTVIGEHEAARDGSLILAATAQEQDVRWMATIHLMELAAREGRVQEFDSYRQRLLLEPLPPAVSAWFQRCVGTACVRFGNLGRAEAAFVRMRTISEENRLARLIIEADELLEKLERQRMHATASTMDYSEDEDAHATPRDAHVRWVAAEITRLREQSGIPA
jgi:tetratricopeptide (TPR) repeat protein